MKLALTPQIGEHYEGWRKPSTIHRTGEMPVKRQDHECVYGVHDVLTRIHLPGYPRPWSELLMEAAENVVYKISMKRQAALLRYLGSWTQTIEKSVCLVQLWSPRIARCQGDDKTCPVGRLKKRMSNMNIT